jgi:hypothetical protein
MPPIVYRTHGPDRTGGGSLTRNLITDQTPETVLDVNAGAVWAFNAVEGLGVAAAAGESIWYFPGDLERQYMLSEWKFITSAAGRYMGMVARASTPGAGALGYYILGINSNNFLSIVSVTGAGDAVLGAVAITAMVENEIFRLQARVIASYAANTQDIAVEHISHGKVSNTPGAAAYNLAAIADPCFLDLKVDGGATQTVTFAAADAIIVANGTLAALTPLGVALVIMNQIAGVRAWVPAATTATVIATNTWGPSGSIDIEVAAADDANAVLGYPLAAGAGAVVQNRLASNARIRGFNGVIGGRSGNTAGWVRSYAISGA